MVYKAWSSIDPRGNAQFFNNYLAYYHICVRGRRITMWALYGRVHAVASLNEHFNMRTIMFVKLLYGIGVIELNALLLLGEFYFCQLGCE